MPGSSSRTDAPGPGGTDGGPDRRGLLAACVVLSLDCLGLVGAGVFLLVRSGGHDASNQKAAVVQGIFALVGALVFGLLAAGCRPDRPSVAVRTPAVILEVIMLPVSIGLFQSGRPELGAPLLLSALLALAGLFLGFRDSYSRQGDG